MNNAINLWMTILRNKETERPMFRHAAHELSRILANHIAELLPTQEISIETPISPTKGIIQNIPILIVPILRSGITMLPAFLEIFPSAQVGVVGLKRDEKTAQAHWYYNNVPPCDHKTYVIIIDPMIATGGTGVATLEYLRQNGAQDKNIFFASMVSAPEGLHAIKTFMPSINILCAAYDPALTPQKYITPGLGDFGDRYFGTEPL